MAHMMKKPALCIVRLQAEPLSSMKCWQALYNDAHHANDGDAWHGKRDALPKKRLDVEKNAATQAAHHGAVATFLGCVRDAPDDTANDAPARITHLSITQYAPMSAASLEAAANDACARWPILRLVMVHRYGHIPLGAPIVFIGVATKHRAAAFAACRFLTERLKTDVLLWKQEHFTDGTARWVELDSSVRT